MKSYIVLYANGVCTSVTEFTDPAQASAQLQRILKQYQGDPNRNAKLITALSMVDLTSDPTCVVGNPSNPHADGVLTDAEDWA